MDTFDFFVLHNPKVFDSQDTSALPVFFLCMRFLIGVGRKGDPCGNRKARAPRPAYRGAKTAPRAVFRAREIPRGRKLMWPGWLMGAHGLPELAQQLSEACGPGMPGPYWVVKGKQSATGRNPSGAAAPPPFDKGGRGSGLQYN